MQYEGNQSALGTIIDDAPVITLSVEEPVPAELAKRIGQCMGLYDPPEHQFRMYAIAAVG